MEKIVVTNNSGNNQWLSFEDLAGGIILKSGENIIDKDIWGKLINRPWVKLLINKNKIVIDEMEKLEEKKNVIKNSKSKKIDMVIGE